MEEYLFLEKKPIYDHPCQQACLKTLLSNFIKFDSKEAGKY